jgi:hypothetical protein
MTTTITRRGILKALGIGAAVVAAEPMLSTLEPVRKLWFVGSNAPVGSRIERVDPEVSYVLGTYALKLQLAQEDLERQELLNKLWTKVRSQEDLDTLRLAARLAEALPDHDRVKLMDDYVAGLKAQKRVMYNCIAWEPAEEYETNHPNNQHGTLVLVG